ncbi:hypothetical protein PV325_008768 [Microctonus aethiopoides]|uniref:F-box domain-containing protein n=1 Tax=Microctonus aethiopoides TaxID=144406 RepID=A0AA39FUS8_9HYME|nr:hypothetical protein PV325_008768 [Microctonus aethiopoides]KAK0096323.1 hypothetical protein PV326_005817 [Microctonus aethiopoides]KAK0176227.1 hypothetical protein PV328_000381 [Microctonus aethiopoides]
MESFAMLMSTIGASSVEHNLIEMLPIEITEIIFRQLDPRSLLNVAQVSKKWMAVCRGNCKIRRTVRDHLQKERRQLLEIDAMEPKSKKIKMNKPSKVRPIPNYPSTFNLASFSFRPSSGAAKREFTEPKGLGNRRSKSISQRIKTRLR